jgi:hypothetical protein
MKTYRHFCSLCGLLNISVLKMFWTKFLEETHILCPLHFSQARHLPPLPLFVKNRRKCAKCAYEKLKLFLLWSCPYFHRRATRGSPLKHPRIMKHRSAHGHPAPKTHTHTHTHKFWWPTFIVVTFTNWPPVTDKEDGNTTQILISVEVKVVPILN